MMLEVPQSQYLDRVSDALFRYSYLDFSSFFGRSMFFSFFGFFNFLNYAVSCFFFFGDFGCC